MEFNELHSLDHGGPAGWPGRGWALWKALITLVPAPANRPDEAVRARTVIGEVLVEHARLHRHRG